LVSVAQSQNVLQSKVSHFVRRLEIQLVGVEVVIDRSGTILANSLGLSGPQIGPLLPSFAIGKITLGESLCRLLNPAELDFVLAHETVHIVGNHVVPSGGLRVLKQIVKRTNPPLANLLDGAEIFLSLMGISVEASLVKEQEIEADVSAICLTGDRASAFSCLSKLVNGDMTRPSHVWEALGVELPVMTMGERIKLVTNRLNESGIPIP